MRYYAVYSAIHGGHVVMFERPLSGFTDVVAGPYEDPKVAQDMAEKLTKTMQVMTK